MLSRVLLSSSLRLTSSRMAPTAFVNSARFFTTSEEPETEDSVPVPKNLVRFIIGPKGSNAFRLTEESGGARIKFSKEMSEDGASEMGRVFGTAEQIAEMKRLIAQDIAKYQADPPSGPPSESFGDYVEEIVVDAEYVGYLIGRGGSLLKEMEASSGARIRYAEADPSQKDRTARIQGTVDQVQACKKLISDKLFERQEEHRLNPDRRRQGRSNSQQPRFRFNESDIKQVVEVPSDIVGSLIGKGGMALHRMQDDTGAKFDFSKEESRPGVKEVTIYGSEDQIQNACDLLQSRVQEINSRNLSRG